MWLPAAGSLHTVVLLTPGKWAARWICLSGLVLMVSFRFRIRGQAVRAAAA